MAKREQYTKEFKLEAVRCVCLPIRATRGSSVASVDPARLPFSGQQDSGSQQVKLGLPIHLPLQQLQPRQLAFHLAVAPD
jgi:hypothetical protein